jgi:hypothetical protein
MSDKSRLSQTTSDKKGDIADTPPAYNVHCCHRLGSSPSSAAGPVLANSPTDPGIRWGAKRACIMLNRTDLLQTVGFPVDVAERMDGLVRAEWKKGVQKQKYHEGCWEWKLSGRPCTPSFTPLRRHALADHV